MAKKLCDRIYEVPSQPSASLSRVEQLLQQSKRLRQKALQSQDSRSPVNTMQRGAPLSPMLVHPQDSSEARLSNPFKGEGSASMDRQCFSGILLDLVISY